MSDQRLVSKAEYARHRSVSGAAVSYWARDGKIVIVDGKVDVDASDDLLAKTTHPTHGGKRGASAQVGPGRPGSGFIESKQRQTDATADLLELRLKRERGDVHETAGCGQAIAALLAGPLSKLDSLFVRIAPQLAAETQVRRIQDIGEDEVARIRQEIADALRGLAARGSATKQ